jgi:hypothetical protein
MPNSTGASAITSAEGSVRVIEENLTLRAAPVSSNVLGLFLMSGAQCRSSSADKARSAPVRRCSACVAPPNVRTSMQSSGGSPGGVDCTGALAFDFNARARSAIDPRVIAGVEIFAQSRSRDPAAAAGSSTTDAARFTICR